MSRNLRYSEDELRDQWSFIDSLVESQAASLRSGAQDPEEEEPAPPAAAAPELLHELDVLRARVQSLEAERRELRERLRLAEMAVPPRSPTPAPAPVPAPQPRRVETRVRDWWRRISR